MERAKEIIRTYELQDFGNLSKMDKIAEIFSPYRKTAKAISNKHWFLFYNQTKRFDKNLDIKELQSKLSERYKQTCQYQVVSMLNSYLSNIQGRFIQRVLNSSVDEDTRIKLLYINKYNKWFAKEVKMQKKLIDESILKLARCIFRNLTKNKPTYNNIILSLDAKVAEVSLVNNENSDFDYWVKISTLDKGKPVSIPLKGYEYFYNAGGLLKNSIQINLRKGKPKISLIKVINFDDKYVANECIKLGLDIGTVNLFGTNYGDLIGIKAMKHLEKMDNIITKLQKNLKKQGIKPNDSKRFVSLNNKLRSFLKNEINRLLNKLVKRYNPKEIHVENLDFRGSNIGKKNNRKLNRFGKKYIKDKLNSLSEHKGIKIEEKNPAYTSQQCSNCNHTEEKNRKTRDKFECRYCGLKLNADINGGKNIVARSSGYNKMSRKQIFHELSKLHNKWKEERGGSSTKEYGRVHKSPNPRINNCKDC